MCVADHLIDKLRISSRANRADNAHARQLQFARQIPRHAMRIMIYGLTGCAICSCVAHRKSDKDLITLCALSCQANRAYSSVRQFV